jgi:hypothetical protein
MRSAMHIFELAAAADRIAQFIAPRGAIAPAMNEATTFHYGSETSSRIF